jgi:PIN domain
MKALDTTILLGLLQGNPAVRDQLRRFRGAELATTEANLIELAWLAGSAPRKVRAARLAALGRLRQRLTVLPIDARASEEVAKRAGRGLPPSTGLLGMLGALESCGCEELYTDRPDLLGTGWSFEVRKLPVGHPK